MEKASLSPMSDKATEGTCTQMAGILSLFNSADANGKKQLATMLQTMRGETVTNSVNSDQANLNLKKAKIIESIYYIVDFLPKQCHQESIDNAVSDFKFNNQELVELVNKSPLYDKVKSDVDNFNAKPKSIEQINAECVQTLSTIKSFNSDAGKTNSANMLRTMKIESPARN